MKKILSTVIMTLVLVVFCSFSLSAAPIFNPATGHYYDLVSGGIFGDALVAEGNAVAGGGHLVTINDAAEQLWLLGAFGSSELFWIGFNDAAVEGSFVWFSGEVPGYTNWSPGEPNDCCTGEDYTVMNWGPDGAWNDFCPIGDLCFVASGISESVPEPASAALVLVGLATLGFAARRRK